MMMNKRKLVTYKGGMVIDNKCSFLNDENIKNIEKYYKATYILETCAKDRSGGWANFPAAIFYTEVAHPQGSNYFAVYLNDGKEVMIANGLSAVDNVVFKGIEVEGKVTYSRYRHDYRDAGNGAFVDGGRDYFRYGGDQFDDYNIVEFVVNKDSLEFTNAN
jgi:hypothetical protein